MFRKKSTKTMMLTLLCVGVAKFVRMWPRFVAKWWGLLFFAVKEKKKKKKKKKEGWGMGLLMILLNLPTEFSMETGDEILPSVITS